MRILKRCTNCHEMLTTENTHHNGVQEGVNFDLDLFTCKRCLTTIGIRTQKEMEYETRTSQIKKG